MSKSLDLAEGAAPDRPERHHSLRAAFTSSWGLLTPGEQRALARLSVFRGGFERPAGSQVGGAPLRTLLGLADHSLLRRDREGRFALHEVVRQYAAEALGMDPAEFGAASRAHAAHFLALAEEAAPELLGPEQARWLERLSTEHDNLRAALAWLLERRDAGAALRLAAALHWFWYVRGHHREGLALLEAALALPRVSGAARELGEYPAARARLDEALLLSQGAGARTQEAKVLHALGLNSRGLGGLEEAQAFLTRAEAIQREVGDRWGLSTSLNDLGITWLLRGEGARPPSLRGEPGPQGGHRGPARGGLRPRQPGERLG
ncbi:tetratricopeptide repeat protein [Deinococcus apachensis]|uniref:tetratricopeptide repeat protein n=1 Tax=Deinococcus apachensis TaxID=309886 RepID=UPI00039F31A9|nr:tetratricopeptide repeat protein [Deinococcus apachensis]